MITIVLTVVMLALLVVCGLMGIIILMQKPSANAGMGAALGGGAAESVFGGEAGNQLLKYTIRMAVAFFAVSFLLYLGVLAQHRMQLNSGGGADTLHQLDTGLKSAAPAASDKTTASGTSSPVTSGKLPAATGAANATLPAASAPAASGAAMASASLPALTPVSSTPAPAASSASASSN